jgi:hypothetical protein
MRKKLDMTHFSQGTLTAGFASLSPELTSLSLAGTVTSSPSGYPGQSQASYTTSSQWVHT